MQVTDTQVKEWRLHPVTQAVFQKLSEILQEAKQAQSYYEVGISADAVAMASAHNTGVAKGIETVIEELMGKDWEQVDES